ncbi:MAG TPA: hypothetical protein VD963_04755 [Phycisphaerales bacterium]|nr:hypothetical protein [Phycisphaerales bacterium]
MAVRACLGAATLLAVLAAGPALGAGPGRTDDEHKKKAEAMAAKAIAFLRARQDPATGGWGVPPPDSGRPAFPAVTALVLAGMVHDRVTAPVVPPTDPAARRGLDYLLGHAGPDGGIYDRLLPSYNTAISLSALVKFADDDRAAAAARLARAFLYGLQWGETADERPEGAESAKAVGKDHPFYGGVGYGQHGRPDLSNLAFFLQAMHDAGVPSDDPAFARALVFLARVQMDDAVNDLAYADGSRQGGFIYATSAGREAAGEGQSFAGMTEETLDDGTRVSRLRAYGSMTYAGFKSLAYAGLGPDDPRVRAAERWIARNYSVTENPGLGTDGLYYYYLVFARALDARGNAWVVPAPAAERVVVVGGLDEADRGVVETIAERDGRVLVWSGGQDERAEGGRETSVRPTDGANVPAASSKAPGVFLEMRSGEEARAAAGAIAIWAGERRGSAVAAVVWDGTGAAPEALRGRLGRDWGNDLIDRLAELQKEDGSFTVVDERWMENDPVLITAYALIALREAMD